MKAQNRKLSSHAYRVHDRSRLSFQGNWYVSPGLLNRLAGREFEIYYDRRDVSVIYLFVDGNYVGEAYCPAFMGQRVSEWDAKAMRQAWHLRSLHVIVAVLGSVKTMGSGDL